MKFNYKQFKYKAFQFRSIVETLLPNTRLEYVWIEYFNEAIHFFEEFRFICNEIFCLDREIKKHFKCRHVFEGFQLAKLVEIQIPTK